VGAAREFPDALARMRAPESRSVVVPDVAVLDDVSRAFVLGLLFWDGTVARVERAARGGISTLAPVLDAARLGVIGTGNRGTKGVGIAPVAERDTTVADPWGTARYQALGREHQRTADAVIEDAVGLVDAPVILEVGLTLTLTLPQRIGLALAPLERVRRWAMRVLVRDAEPLRSGTDRIGRPAIRAAAEVWHGCVPPTR
jgi:hypothetical protein